MLELLEDRDVERQQELSQYSDSYIEREHIVSSACPILDGVYRDGGSEAVSRLTNFSPREFNTLWMSVRGHVLRYWNVGRGKRSTYAAKDVFFMLLAVMKCGGTWEMLSNIFQIKTPTFIKTITVFLRVVAPKLYDTWVAERADDQKMRSLVTSGHTFQHFPCALYATDVTFQQSNRPAGSMAEALPWYSAKHKLYGYKVEVSVNPRGLAVNCTNHARGNTADITMFRNNQAFHMSARRKVDGDHRLVDHGPLLTEYPDEWAVLADKGYQGLADHVRCVHPKKGKTLTTNERKTNDNISSDRVIVENYFGRLCGLWRICADKFRWSEELYDDIFHVCASLTNFHITMHPLREDSGSLYRQHHNRLIAIGDELRNKRRFNQEKYRRSKRLRHQMELDDHPSNDSFSDVSEADLSDGGGSTATQLSLPF